MLLASNIQLVQLLLRCFLTCFDVKRKEEFYAVQLKLIIVLYLQIFFPLSQARVYSYNIPEISQISTYSNISKTFVSQIPNGRENYRQDSALSWRNLLRVISRVMFCLLSLRIPSIYNFSPLSPCWITVKIIVPSYLSARAPFRNFAFEII